METRNLLAQIMIFCLLAVCYLFVVHMLAKRSVAKGSLPAAALILLVVFLLLGGTLLVLSFSIGAELVLLCLLLLVALLTLCAAVVYLIGNFQALHLGTLAIFLLYLVVIGYVTLFSRGTAGDRTIHLLRTDLIAAAVSTHSLQPLQHIFLNIALFFPIGFLLPGIDREKLDDLSITLLLSLTLTVLIETLQMVFQLGQADLTDILANTLGGILGHLVYRLLSRLFFARADSADDDDDLYDEFRP